MAKTPVKQKATGRRPPRKAEVIQAQKQTRKQIAHGRKQARQNRIIWMSIAALAAVILLILGIGFVSEGLIKPNRPVAIVNGTRIRTDDYQSLLTYRRFSLHGNMDSLNSYLETLDPEDETSQFIRSFYEQQIQQLQSALVLAPDDALDELIEDELIREKAEELQFTVTPADVDQAIEAMVDDLRQSISPQLTVTETQQTPTPTPIPTNTLYSYYLDLMGLSNGQFRTIVHRGQLRSEVWGWFAGQVVTTGLVVHVQLIQTETEEEALAAKARIDGGEDFAVVAQEVSTDTLSAADGGDLGWVATGQLSERYGEEVENTVFSQDVGQMDLVESNGMFYLVQLLDRDENGPLPEEVLSPLQNNALDEWLSEQKDSPDVQIERLLESDQIPDDPFLEPSTP